MAADFLSIEGLTRSFGGLRALDDLSFQIEEGMIFSVIGPNGAGKTTLFNCISGIYRTDSGAITFMGEKINGLRPDQIARLGIARTFQNIELFAHMTTMENLMLGRHIHMNGGVWRGASLLNRRFPAARDEVVNREKVEGIIDLLDLQAARNRFVGTLPYGIQKLVELGRALALEPKLLLLDEPAAGMNSEERHDLFFWIQDIRKDLGITIIMIEHNLQMVMDVSDRILALDFGRKIAEGLPDEVANHPDVIKAYLGEDDSVAATA